MTHRDAIALIEECKGFVGKTFKHIYGWEYKIESMKIQEARGENGEPDFKPVCVATYSKYVQFTVNLKDLREEIAGGRLFEI